MSALDLFASALGAFILITITLFPYFPNIGSSPENVARLKAQLQASQQQLQASQQQLQNCQANLSQTQKALQESKSQNMKFALLGITTTAQSFVIVIDMSGSMKEYTQIMENIMYRILEPFDDRNTVQIIGYNGAISTLPWQTPNNTLVMNTSNKNQANNFVKSLSARFSDSTPTNDALEKALKYNVEAVLLLTDGSPNGDPDDIISNISNINNGIKEIHTIAIGKYHGQIALVDFLQELAKQNRGGFVGVSN